jgi:threonine/homoserine/homoserine lactone efflux protein
MDLQAFVEGAVIGFGVAAPVGQIGILCIRRTLAEGPVVGIASGVGAATADLAYGLVAAFGLTLVSNFIQSPAVQVGVRLFGGLFLCYLAVQIFRSVFVDEATATPSRNLGGAYLSTFALTITNPATIVLYTSVFASLKVVPGDYGRAALIAAGIFAGSMLWWVILSLVVGWLRTRFTRQMIRAVNIVSGLVLFGIGAWAILSLLSAPPASG